MSDGGMSRRKYPFQWGHCPFTGVLALSAEIVDDRPCVVHLRRSPASWMNAQSLYINHCWRKMCGLNKQKNGCHRKVPWAIAISQQSSTPIKLPILKNSRRRSRTFWNNWTRTNSKNRKHFRQFGSFKVIKRCHSTDHIRLPIRLPKQLYAYISIILLRMRDKNTINKIGCHGNAPWGIKK